MVAAECDARTADCCVVIRPNCSLSWQRTVAVYCGMCGVSLTIALGFAILGFWMILPFAGLEMIALAAGFYYCAVRADTREVIRIQGETVTVQKGRHCPKDSTQFQRVWTRVVLAQPQQRRHPARLLICSHGRALEVGQCLNEQERSQLAADLRRWIRTPSTSLQAA